VLIVTWKNAVPVAVVHPGPIVGGLKDPTFGEAKRTPIDD
jgi:hypothetical protein